jgi:hypothetical protein
MERHHENANGCYRVRYVTCCTGFRAVRTRMGMERRGHRSDQRHVRVRCCLIRRPPRRAVGSPRRAAVMAFEHVLDALQLQCLPGEPVVPDQLQLNFGRRPSEGS